MFGAASTGNTMYLPRFARLIPSSECSESVLNNWNLDRFLLQFIMYVESRGSWEKYESADGF